MTTFRERLDNRETLIGTIVTLPAPELAEMASRAGFDWLWLDMEHGLLDVDDIQRAAMAAGSTACLARVPVNEEAWIKRVLDTGVAGLVIPQVNTVELAQRAAKYTRYPPVGMRSVGAGRAQGYGQGLTDYLAHADAEIVLLIQIEHIQAVENLEAILAVPGVDGVIVGPYDLSASMGKTGQLGDAEVRAKIATIRETCLRLNKPVGIFTGDQAAAQRALQEGFQLVNVGTDVMVLSSAWVGLRSSLR